jgi:DNA-binding transcriptional MocR family regulator
MSLVDSAARAPAADATGLALLDLRIDRNAGVRLVDQVVQGIQDRVRSRLLYDGARLPSIRQLAQRIGVSTFTAADAYETLIALNQIESRPGAGHFIKKSRARELHAVSAPIMVPHKFGEGEAPWMSCGQTGVAQEALAAGCGWMPSQWYDPALLQEAMRKAARMNDSVLTQYAHPAGHAPLREHMARHYSEQFSALSPQQIITTNGATHALELLISTLLAPGDVVLVEDPSYWNVLNLLRRHGCQIESVARNEQGLDLAAFEQQVQRHRPKLAFITTVLHNPLSTTLSQAQVHRLLAIAEREDILLIEDDVFRSLESAQAPCLAGMDGFSRVVLVSSFSKSISPALRVGYIVAPPWLAPMLTQAKMTCSLSRSPLNEAIALHVITDPGYRRHLRRLQARAQEAQDRLQHRLLGAGLTLLAKPHGGLFVSAGWAAAPSAACNALSIAAQAHEQGITLAPADLFEVRAPKRIWFRFNAGHSHAPKVFEFLAGISTRLGSSTGPQPARIDHG